MPEGTVRRPTHHADGSIGLMGLGSAWMLAAIVGYRHRHDSNISVKNNPTGITAACLRNNAAAAVPTGKTPS